MILRNSSGCIKGLIVGVLVIVLLSVVAAIGNRMFEPARPILVPTFTSTPVIADTPIVQNLVPIATNTFVPVVPTSTEVSIPIVTDTPVPLVLIPTNTPEPIIEQPTVSSNIVPAFTCAGGCAIAPNPACNIKGNVNSDGERIFHTTDSRSYNITDIKPKEGDRWFCTPDEALAAGFRAPYN